MLHLLNNNRTLKPKLVMSKVHPCHPQHPDGPCSLCKQETPIHLHGIIEKLLQLEDVDEVSCIYKLYERNIKRNIYHCIIPVHHDVDNILRAQAGTTRYPDPQTTKFISLLMVTLKYQETILGQYMH